MSTVNGPGSSTLNSIPTWSNTSGDTLQDNPNTLINSDGCFRLGSVSSTITLDDTNRFAALSSGFYKYQITSSSFQNSVVSYQSAGLAYYSATPLESTYTSGFMTSLSASPASASYNGTLGNHIAFYDASRIASTYGTENNIDDVYSFYDSSSGYVANNSVLNVTDWTSFLSAPWQYVYNGGTLNIWGRRGLWVKDFGDVEYKAGTVNLTAQIGVDIDDLHTGAVNIGIRQQGTNSYNILNGKTRIGSSSAPSVALQVSDAISGSAETITFAGTMSADVTKGNLKIITGASGPSTLNASGPGISGQHMWIKFTGDSGAGRTLTLGNYFHSAGNMQTGGQNNKTVMGHFVSDGSGWWEIAKTNSLS